MTTQELVILKQLLGALTAKVADSIDSVEETIRSIEVDPEIPQKVEVINQIKPEKIPDFPKQLDVQVQSLPTYVQSLLKDLISEVKKKQIPIKVETPKVEVAAPDLSLISESNE